MESKSSNLPSEFYSNLRVYENSRTIGFTLDIPHSVSQIEMSVSYDSAQYVPDSDFSGFGLIGLIGFSMLAFLRRRRYSK